MYDVKSIDYPWFNGIGFLQGRPSIRINIGKSEKSRRLTAHQIAAKISSIAPMRKEQSPRWVAIIGETSQADNTLKLVLGSTIGKLTYIESHGARSMCDSTGRLPIWDHVCLRTKVPADPEKIQIFHSVIVEGKTINRRCRRL